MCAKEMSSKRKSPPTKLEGGGGVTNAQNNIQQSPVHIDSSSPIQSNNNKTDAIPTTTTATNLTTKSCLLERGTQSPANSTDIGGSEPDVDSYHSSQSPVSDIDRTDDRVGIDVKVEDRANDDDEDDEAEVGLPGDNSDYEEPCKKQRLEFDASWPISPYVLPPYPVLTPPSRRTSSECSSPPIKLNNLNNNSSTANFNKGSHISSNNSNNNTLNHNYLNSLMNNCGNASPTSHVVAAVTTNHNNNNAISDNTNISNC
ncbi:hypothetical protein Bhyg_05941, partial [Pseudolycoriella hygida]